MAYSLKKPCTDEARVDFIIKYNRKQGLQIVETDSYLYALAYNEIMQDDKPVVNSEYTKYLKELEEERINNLTMTALDFINVLKSAGFTSEQIEDYLNKNLAVKHQLQFCQNVYCGVAKALMPITVGNTTITADMVEKAFKDKYEE